jgi:GNAT superfamily N-acetyltransferase
MTQDITINPANQTEFEVAREFLTSFYVEEGLSTSAEEIAFPLETLCGGLFGRVFLARRNDKVIGIAASTLSIGLKEAGFFAELTDLYVAHDAANSGVSEKLTDATVNWARDRGCTMLKVILKAYPDRCDDLHDFYRRNGYAETRRTVVVYALGTL